MRLVGWSTGSYMIRSPVETSPQNERHRPVNRERDKGGGGSSVNVKIETGQRWGSGLFRTLDDLSPLDSTGSQSRVRQGPPMTSIPSTVCVLLRTREYWGRESEQKGFGRQS